MQLKSSRRDLWLVVATAIASLLAIGVLRGQSPAPVPLPPNGVDPPTVCGTRADSHLTGAIAPAAILPDGEPLFFDQDPPLVFSDHDGPITLRNFNIVG